MSKAELDDSRSSRLCTSLTLLYGPNGARPYRNGRTDPHFRLGAKIARRKITVMFREPFHRLPDLRISGEPARPLSGFMNGIKHMPCEFTPGGR